MHNDTTAAEWDEMGYARTFTLVHFFFLAEEPVKISILGLFGELDEPLSAEQTAP